MLGMFELILIEIKYAVGEDQKNRLHRLCHAAAPYPEGIIKLPDQEIVCQIPLGLEQGKAPEALVCGVNLDLGAADGDGGPSPLRIDEKREGAGAHAPADGRDQGLILQEIAEDAAGPGAVQGNGLAGQEPGGQALDVGGDGDPAGPGGRRVEVLIGCKGRDEIISPGNGENGQAVFRENGWEVYTVVKFRHEAGLPELLDLGGGDEEPALPIHRLQDPVFLKEALPGGVIQSHSL